MVKKSHGYRARTRSLMSKRVRTRGIASLSRVLVDYEIGQRVDIVINPSVHKGMPHRRYQGRTGVVTGIRGRGIVVDVKLGKATKTLIVRPDHLQPSISRSSGNFGAMSFFVKSVLNNRTPQLMSYPTPPGEITPLS